MEPSAYGAAASRDGSQSESGRGELCVEMVAGESAAVSTFATSPLKILVPQPRGPSVWAYTSSFGGGLVAGDETNVSVHLRERSRCFFSTQSSTKIYRNPGFRPCGQRLEAFLGDQSLLVLAPDPIQAFAGSSYRQIQRFQLEPASGLVALDWMCSGRSARGERWAFDGFRSRNEVFFGNERVLVDSLLLDPADGPLESACRMGRFNCLALVLILGESVRLAAERILQSIAARPVTRGAAVICSASPVSHGALIRVAAERVEDARGEVRRLLDFVPALLKDDPWARKW